MPDFIPGLRLSELFFRDAIQPLIAKRFPSMPYSAGLLQTGSDVLGFDTPLSRDHGWGPRCMLFLREHDYASHAAQVRRVLGEELPLEFLGYPTSFTHTDAPVMSPTDRRPITHWVEVTTIHEFFGGYIGVNPREAVTERDWLALPSQKLRTIRSGRVFHDGLAELQSCRAALDWYPHELWLYLLACQWRRIDQEEPFMARSGDVGDGLGSRVIAARLIEDLMKLCFLIERKYPPYSKWFGTGFARLRCAAELTPIFERALDARIWQDCERELSSAYLVVQRMHNELNLTPPIEPRIASFHNRAYQVPHAGRYVERLYEAITSPAVQSLPRHLGAVWQFTNAVDVLEDVSLCRALIPS